MLTVTVCVVTGMNLFYLVEHDKHYTICYNILCLISHW